MSFFGLSALSNNASGCRRFPAACFPTASPEPNTVHLTAKAVAALRLPAGKHDVIYFDASLPGFGYRLRAGAGGKVLRSWVAQYRRARGSRRITLGAAAVLSAEQARKEAKKVLGRVAIGEDPQADRVERRDKDALSFQAVVAEHLAAKKLDVRARTHVELTRYLTGPRYFKPLHSMPVDKVTRKDVAAALVRISRESNSAAARARAALNGFFVWAMRMGMIEANPVIGTIEPKRAERRERVLTDTELAAIWRACDDSDHGQIVKLLILTGCRRQEVGSMRWSELNADAGTWTIPAERAKNGRTHTLTLPPAAWAIINSVPRRVSRDYLFGMRSAGFRSWGDGRDDLNEALGDTVAPFVLHDIRRSVATKLADIGVQPHVIEQILNHVSGHKAGIAGIYNRSSYEREVKAALALWADHVRVLAEGGERKVVHMYAPAG
jgi:integrase